MTIQSVEKLQEIFRAVFELPPRADVTGLSQGADGKWDSLAHMSLVAAIESEFDTTLDTSDTLRLTSYQATARVLEEKGL